MPGIGDFIKSLLGMAPNQQPAQQAGQQAPYQPPSGTLLEALGVPLALFGAYEAARGRPIGAPAGLAGAGLSYLGNQRNQNATAYSAFEAALQAAQKRAPVGSGVQEQLKALEPVGQADPTEGINETKDVLKQYFEQQKAKVDDRDAFSIQEYGVDYRDLKTKEQRTRVNALTKDFKARAAGGGEPWFLKNPVGQQLFANGVMDPSQVTPEAMTKAINDINARGVTSKETVAKYASSLGFKPVYHADSGITTYEPTPTVGGGETKPEEAPKNLDPAYTWTRGAETGLPPGYWIGDLKSPTTLGGAALRHIPSRFSGLHTKVLRKPDGSVVPLTPGTTIP